MGIEPTYPAWKAGVLPLNYTRIIKYKAFNKEYIGVTGFEPAASWSQTRRSSQTEPHPVLPGNLPIPCHLSATQELLYPMCSQKSTIFLIFCFFIFLPDILS